MQETEEETVITLDLQEEDQTNENDRIVIECPKKTRAEIKENARPPFFLKRVIKRVKRKLLEWWNILGEDEVG